MSTTIPTEPSEEVKKIAFQKIANISIYHLFQIVDIINLASTRGAFRGAELSYVGGIFDILTAGVNKGFELAKEELAKVDEIKLPSITEEKSDD